MRTLGRFRLPKVKGGFDAALEHLHHIHYRQCQRKKRQLKRLQKKLKRTVGPERVKILEQISTIEQWIHDVYEERSKEIRRK